MCLGGSNVISCPAILSTYSGDLHVLLRKWAQPWNIYHRGTMARLIEPCVPLWVSDWVSVCVWACVCVCAHIRLSAPQPPFFPLPIVKDYLDLLCGRLICPAGWLVDILFVWCTPKTNAHTCINTHSTQYLCCESSHTTLPVLPSTHVDYMSVAVGACVHLYHPWLDWSISVGLSIVEREKRIDDCFIFVSL